jgi:hypothetical protein
MRGRSACRDANRQSEQCCNYVAHDTFLLGFDLNYTSILAQLRSGGIVRLTVAFCPWGHSSMTASPTPIVKGLDQRVVNTSPAGCAVQARK